MNPELTDPVEWFNENFEPMIEKYSLEKDYMQGYVELLEKFGKLVSSGKVLDAGCGWGRDVNYFNRNGLNALGVDRAPRPLKYAEENMHGEFQRMDVAHLAFRDETFDGVWCNSVIHFYKPGKMRKPVSELARVLKKGGILYINFKLTEGEPEPDVREEEDGSLVKRYLILQEYARELLEKSNLEVLGEYCEVNTEDFENPVWSVFCRKK
ncbi:MAG: class I SAM-dependent methyltransferase [Candidatus Nanosalina sp.]